MSRRLPNRLAPVRLISRRHAASRWNCCAGGVRFTRPGAPRLRSAAAPVIVLDDGLATGATMIAALHAVRQQQPARLICAVPVAGSGLPCPGGGLCG
ncbi:phosphoribosyltransferase family protein [Cupriavidus basilensis]